MYLQLDRAHAQLVAAHYQATQAADRIAVLTRLTERQRLARELHDTLAQGLAGFTMQLQATQTQLEQQAYSQAHAMLAGMRETARELLTLSRATIDDLRANDDLERIDVIVQAEVARFQAATGISCVLESASIACFTSMPKEYGEHLRQFFREGLLNIARHAYAQHTWIHAQPYDDHWAIDLQDDGKGFVVVDHTAHPGHYGLVGLQERAQLMGGQCTVRSAPGMGTTVHLEVPRKHTI